MSVFLLGSLCLILVTRTPTPLFIVSEGTWHLVEETPCPDVKYMCALPMSSFNDGDLWLSVQALCPVVLSDGHGSLLGGGGVSRDSSCKASAWE